MVVSSDVSVVIPCYRCGTSVSRAVASVFKQTIQPKEVVLVDDGSHDGTLEVLFQLRQHYPSGWIRVESLSRNSGPSAARNFGWSRANGEFIAFLDADDSWHPRKLEIQMSAFRKHPDLTLLGSPSVLLRPGDSLPEVRHARIHRIGRTRMVLHNPFQTSSVIVRRSIPFRFDENRKRAEDYLLWAQIILSGYAAALIDAPLAFVHKPVLGAGGLSGDIEAMYKAGRSAHRELLTQDLITMPEYLLAVVSSKARQLIRRLGLRRS